MRLLIVEDSPALADSLRRFIDTEYTFEARRKSARQGESLDRGVWNKLAEMGVLGLTVPADFGGCSDIAATFGTMRTLSAGPAGHRTRRGRQAAAHTDDDTGRTGEKPRPEAAQDPAGTLAAVRTA